MNFNKIEFDTEMLKPQIETVKKLFRNCDDIQEKYYGKKGVDEERVGTQQIFENNPMLLSAMGWLTFSYGPATKWIREMPFGDFQVDFAIANEDESEIALIEFEPAVKEAVFKVKNEGKDTSYEWGEILEHGCGQLYDWMYYVHDAKQTGKFRNLFECESPEIKYIVVAGWKKHANKKLLERLKWRKDSLVMDSNKISVYFYDELIEQICKTLEYGKIKIKMD